ncbi:hypothetical protein BS78_02G292900 [Paspalum vaginatum]|nr:hypothetical protein BS78_02G292900 [Paspalum vaginatum]
MRGCSTRRPQRSRVRLAWSPHARGRLAPAWAGPPHAPATAAGEAPPSTHQAAVVVGEVGTGNHVRGHDQCRLGRDWVQRVRPAHARAASTSVLERCGHGSRVLGR